MSGLDIKRLRELQPRLDKLAKEEVFENLKESFIQITLDSDLKDLFRGQKDRNISENSKRIISHWVQNGIINAEQDKKGGWYYFNRIESIWIEIITQLRGFGIGLDKIKKVREQLFNEEIDGFSLIEFVMIFSILKEPYLIILNQEGNIKLMRSTLYSKSISTSVFPPHLTINLYQIAKKIYPNNNFHLGNKITPQTNLSQQDLKLFYLIKTGDYEEIKIRLNKDDIYLVEGKKTITNTDKIIDIIDNNSYQDIQIKTEKGKLVYISATNKVKI